jgi:P4 family phage/plasmid primase-like protien
MDYSMYEDSSVHQRIAAIRSHEQLETEVNRFLDTISPKDYMLREIYEYVMILPESYYGAGSYNKWIRVGWALKNISERLLVIWIRFCTRASTFTFSSVSDLCMQWSNDFLKKRDGLTDRSIMYWAMQDNYEGFKQVKQNTVSNLLDQTIAAISINSLNQAGKAKGSGDYDIARVLYELYKFEYKCISVKNNIWYRFKNHRWTEIDSGTTLRRAISDVLRDLYTDKANQINSLAATIDPDGPESEQKKVLLTRAGRILDICEKLGRTNDKRNIMIEARDLFYDPEFMQRIDNNPLLMCFSNGVYDFEQKCFRKGLPEDYITKCTNCDYHALSSPKHVGIIEKIKVFMQELFPRPELCQYMWDHLASTLLGTSSVNQTFNMYIGEGQNGKSVLTDLMSQVLGNYKVGVPITLLTGARGKIGGLAPEVVAMKGARYAVIQEPDSNERINVGVMKELVSGVEPIKARAPYMLEPVEFVPQFKLVLCANEFMEIKSRDHGTWRRIRIVPFETLFTDNPVQGDPDKPFQFKVDREILKQFPVWRETFAAMLVDRVNQTGGRVQDCDIVLTASNTYKERQDYMAQFVSERICKQPGDSLRKAHLSEEFKIWFQTNFGTKPPSTKDLHEYVDKTFGKNRAGVWANIRIRYDDASGNSLPSAIMSGPVDDMGEIEFE